MAVERIVPATPSVGDAIRNLGGEAPPESEHSPAETGTLSPSEPFPLAAVESNTGMRSGGWDSAADAVELRSAVGSGESEPTETIFVPVAPPQPVSPPSHIAFAPATTAPDAASHRVSDVEPTPYMPATGTHRVPTQSVAAGLAAMGLETAAEPEYDAPTNPGDFQFAAGPADAALIEPAFAEETVSVPEPLAPLPPVAAEAAFVPPFPLTPTPVPAAIVAPIPPAPIPPVPIALAPLVPAPIEPAAVAPQPEPAYSGPVSAPPVFARAENIAPESAEPEFIESDAPGYAAPVPAEPAHVMPPLGPEGVYSVAPPVASVLPGAPKLPPVAPAPAPVVETPEAEYADGPDPAAYLETSGYEYQPETYQADDPREALRSATRRAVDRLTQPVPPPVTEPARVVVPESHLPRIVELTMQVERAVIGAAAAERFQREIEQTAREAAADVISTAATEAQRTLDSATAESQSLIAGARAEAEKLLADTRAESGKLLSDAQAERNAIIARAESQAKATVAQADIELDRRLRRIAALTDEIVDIAESAAERTGAGAMSGPQIAQFIGALGTVTDRALEHLEQANQTTSNPTPKVTDDASVSAEAEIES